MWSGDLKASLRIAAEKLIHKMSSNVLCNSTKYLWILLGLWILWQKNTLNNNETFDMKYYSRFRHCLRNKLEIFSFVCIKEISKWYASYIYHGCLELSRREKKCTKAKSDFKTSCLWPMGRYCSFSNKAGCGIWPLR